MVPSPLVGEGESEGAYVDISMRPFIITVLLIVVVLCFFLIDPESILSKKMMLKELYAALSQH